MQEHEIVVMTTNTSQYPVQNERDLSKTEQTCSIEESEHI